MSKTRVHEFTEGIAVKTRVWMSDEVNDALDKRAKKHHEEVGRILKRLMHYAKSGFENYTGKKPNPIRPEWDAAFRIGEDFSLFRFIGGFDGENFIILDCFEKSGTALGDRERERIKQVAETLKHNRWEYAE